MPGGQTVHFALGAVGDAIRRRVSPRAFYANGQVFHVAGLGIVAAHRRATANRVHRAVLVHRHVTAGVADLTAIKHVAALDVVDEKVILRLSAVVELAAGVIDGTAAEALLFLEDAHA